MKLSDLGLRLNQLCPAWRKISERNELGGFRNFDAMEWSYS